MRYTWNISIFLIIFSSLLTFTGCEKGALFLHAPGKYQGVILSKKTGNVKQSLVTTEISLKSKDELQIKEFSDDTQKTTFFVLRVESDSKVWLLFPDWGNAKVHLHGASENCFVSDPNLKTFSATLCFNGLDLTMDLNWGAGGNAYTLSVSRDSTVKHPTFEHPQDYTVDQLLKLGMNQNFDSPIQFERVVQAKTKTELAYLELTPHISVNTILNLASFNVIGVLKAVGDLLPFLFPSKWLRVKESKYRSEAEFDAWILTKADAANVVEGLAYGVLRDSVVISTIEENQKYIAEIRDQVQERERAGLMQVGASDDIESILNAMDRGNSALRSSLILEKIALAQGAGFYNFAAITNVQATDDLSIDHLKSYDDTTIARLSDTALDRSYERRQLNSLIEASKIGESERYFQWLDPSGEHDGDLGFNLIPYVKIGASETRELIDKRQKIEAGIIDMVARNATIANRYLEDYGLARSGYEIQNRRVERHLNNMRSGINFSMSDLTNALQERLKAEIELIDAQYAYHIAKANLNRALLVGPYAWLPSNRGQPSWIISSVVDLR